MRRSDTIVPSKEAPRWLYEILRDIQRGQDSTQFSIAAIGRGEVPDGSGQPLADLDRFFFLPGRVGGQTAFQADSSVPTLEFKGTSYLKFAPDGFTVTNCTTAGTATLTTTSSFVPSGGPTVVPGMLITGTDIPANTYVRNVATSTSLTMTNLATGSSSLIPITFTPSVTLDTVTDETGKDIEWLARGGVRFTVGTENVPFRVAGDYSSLASGIAATGRIYLETGYVSGGAGIGQELQIGGPNRGELNHFNLWSRTIWFNKNPNAANRLAVGMNINPAEFGDAGAGFGALYTLHLRPNSTGSIIIDAASAPSGGTRALTVRGAPSGSSPNRSHASSDVYWELMDNGIVRFLNGAGSGAYVSGITDALAVRRPSTNLGVVLSIAGISVSDKTYTLPNYSGIPAIPTNEGTSGFFLKSAGAGVQPTWSSLVSSTITVADNLFSIVDDGNNTRVAQFQCSGISDSTTRTFTFPNVSSTLAVLSLAQTFTKTQTFLSDTDVPGIVAQSSSGGVESPLKLLAEDGTSILYAHDFAGGLYGAVGPHFQGISLSLWPNAVGNNPFARITTNVSASRTWTFPDLGGTILIRGGQTDLSNQSGAPSANLIASAVGANVVYQITAWGVCQRVGDVGDKVDFALTWTESNVAVSCTSDGVLPSTITRAAGNFFNDGVAEGDTVTGPGVPGGTVVTAMTSNTTLTVNTAVTNGVAVTRVFSRPRSFNFFSLLLDVIGVQNQSVYQFKTRVFGVGSSASAIAYSSVLTSPGALVPIYSVGFRVMAV